MSDLLKQYEPYRKDLEFIDRYCDAQNSAAGSDVDPNSNVSNHNIATLAPEIHKSKNVFMNRLRMHDTIKELFGEELADQYLNDLENHILYRHDESVPVGMPYCLAMSLYPFITDGTKIMHEKSSAPNNLDSFCGSFINLVFSVAGQFAGAVATPSFFTVFTYYCIREWGEDFYLNPDKIVYHTANKDKTIHDFLAQKYQQLTYSLNSASGNRGNQSVFWNVSSFDKYFFERLFKNVWFPDGTEVSAIWPQVNYIQKDYMMWLNKEREKEILTFPVETFSLLNDGKKYLDEDSAKFVAEMHARGHSFFIYTSNSVDSLASCCYSGDTLVKVCDKNGEPVVLRFEELPAHPELMMPDDTYNVWCLSEYRKGKLVILPNRKMYEVKLENGAILRMTDNHRNYVFDSNDHEVGSVLTKDLIPYEHSYICGDGITFSYVKVVSIDPYDYDGPVWCFEMVGDNNRFALANGVYNYNCRLRNALDEEENQFSYTLGAGGIATGSKCVMTLNINRLVQNVMRKKYGFSSGHIDEVRDTSKLDENLDAICAEVRMQAKKVHKYLLSFEKIMQDMLAKDMLPVYKAGFISPEKQFLTLGVNGVVNGAQYLGLTISDNPDYKKYVQKILGTISEVDKEDRDREHGIKFNCEMVPGRCGDVKPFLIS